MDSIIYIPISAVNGENISNSKSIKFECGNKLYNESFMEIISKLEMPPRPIDKPFRMTITNVFEPHFGKLTGHCLSGKI